MRRGFLFAFAAALLACLALAWGPPVDVSAQDAVWRPDNTKGIKGANFYTFAGACTSEYALTNSSTIWFLNYRMGADSTAADTLYFKVHDKNNDEWLVFRGKTSAVGGMFSNWYYAPEIDSLSYSSANASAWLQLQCFYGY